MTRREKQALIDQGHLLPLMEEFYTIQGEGYHKGTAAYFVRIGGCDVGCHWCDVKESWLPELHPATEATKIVENAVKFVGEQDGSFDNTEQLKAKGVQTHIETSGAYKLTGQWDWICLSPKKMKLPTAEVYEQAHELKCIVYNKDDFKFAEEQAAKTNKDCIFYLQPEWSKRDKMMPQIVDYVMANPKWKVSLQTHKYLNIP
jgi:organic radical activating enzyme